MKPPPIVAKPVVVAPAGPDHVTVTLLLTLESACLLQHALDDAIMAAERLDQQ